MKIIHEIGYDNGENVYCKKNNRFRKEYRKLLMERDAVKGKVKNDIWKKFRILETDELTKLMRKANKHLQRCNQFTNKLKNNQKISCTNEDQYDANEFFDTILKLADTLTYAEKDTDN